MKKILFLFFIVVIIFSGSFFVFKRSSQLEYIDFNDIQLSESKKEKDTVSIGMISVTGSTHGYVLEKELVNYIGRKLGKKIKFVQRKSYKEINNLLQNKEIDIAFLSTGAYSLYPNKDDIELIARPNIGRSFYNPVLIVKNNSEIDDLEELENKDFAFVDAYSYSGYLVLSHYLKNKSDSVDNFFKNKYYFTNSHEQSVRQVANGNVKGAVIDEWTLRYLEKNNPTLYSEVKIIKTFPEVATGPVVTAKDFVEKEKLKNILFNIHTDSDIKNVLEELRIKHYEDTNKKDYPNLVGEQYDK